ncbi:MAG TPA: hypothetical protein VGN29_21410 [Solirubrobacteraceae bacterium]|nr:hypothetical protein [Solirubrobacteraceae bacterium]
MSEIEVLRRAWESVEEPDESTTRDARVRLLGDIESLRRPAPHSRLRPLANRRLAVAIPLVACLMLVVALSLRERLTAVTPADAAVRRCSGRGPADACLRALAQVARVQAPLAPVVYQKLQQLRPELVRRNGLQFRVVGVVTVESWLNGTQGTALQRTSLERLHFPTAHDRLVWMRAGSPSARAIFGSTPARTRVRAIPNTDVLFFSDLRAWQRATGSTRPGRFIPTDPARVLQLLDRVRRISGAPGPVGALADLPLRDPLLLPAQRAALFAALAMTPGARRVTLRDPLHRVGIAIIGRSGYAGSQWITLFDVHTSRVLAEGVQGQGSVASHTPGTRRVWLEVFRPQPRITPVRP